MPRGRENHRSPTPEEVQLCRGQFELEELIDPTDITDLMALARQRIIGVWRHERQTIRRQRLTKAEREMVQDTFLTVDVVQIVSNENQGVIQDPLLVRLTTSKVHTDNYIIGVSNKQTDLAWHLYHHMRNYFVDNRYLRDLSMDWSLEVSHKLRASFVAHLQQKAILLELNALAELRHIWYDEGLGIWQIKQSVVDEHLVRRKAARRRVKDDDRSEHGQNRSQRKERERSSGSSTGMTKRSGNGSNRRSW